MVSAPSARKIAFVTTARTLLHVVPIAAIQCSDYITDILVIFKLFDDGQSVSGWTALSCVILSVVVFAVALCFLQTSCQDAIAAILLAPLNLHTLYLGWAHAVATSELPELRRAAWSSDGVPELFEKYDEAIEAESEAHKRKDRPAYKEAKAAVRHALNELMNVPSCNTYMLAKLQAQNLYTAFILSKAVESGIESLPLAVITTAQVFSKDLVSQDDIALYGSSLALSCLSMAYAYLCGSIQVRKWESNKDDNERLDPTKSRKPMLFVAILVNVVWSLYCMGICYGTDSLAPANFILPLLVLFLHYLLLFVPASVAFAIEDGEMSPIYTGFTFGLLISLESAAADSSLFTPHVDGDNFVDPFVERMVLFGMPLLRRILLVSMAVAATLSQVTLLRAVSTGVGFIFDACAGVYVMITFSGWLDNRGNQSTVQHLEQGSGQAHPGSAAQDASDGTADEQLHSRTLQRNELLCQDYIEALLFHVDKALRFTVAQPCGAPMLESLQGLQQQCQELSRRQLAAAEADQVIRAARKYVPSEDGSAEAKLLHSLAQLQNEFSGDSMEPPEFDCPIQPLHVVGLQQALDASVWTTVPSFFGKKPVGTAFEKSFRAQKCNYFCSHSWRDDGQRKVAMLREFLFLQEFIANTLVIFGLFAVFLLPLGFGLHGQWEDFNPWIPSTLILSLVALLLVWVVLSLAGVVPATLHPWDLSTTTVWIDKLCIDQTSDSSKQAGVASFPEVLKSSERMVALISSSYFSRMWCVYELAIFARDKPHALLLFSLDWPSSLNPLKSSKVSEKEFSLLRNFSCRDADCFVPKDRVTVLNAIRTNFGSEVAFDNFVRTKLPAVLQSSKHQYCSRLTQVGLQAFALAFGS